MAILIKSDIQHSLINKTFDGDTLAITTETTTGPVIIGTNYSPPSRIIFPMRDIMWFARHRTSLYLLADLNAHHTTFDTFSNDYGKVLYNMWLEDGFLQRLGPDTGTHTSNAGNLSKPDIVLTNRQMYHFYHVSTLDRNVSDHAPMSLEISNKPIKIPAPLHEIYKKSQLASFHKLH